MFRSTVKFITNGATPRYSHLNSGIYSMSKAQLFYSTSNNNTNNKNNKNTETKEEKKENNNTKDKTNENNNNNDKTNENNNKTDDKTSRAKTVLSIASASFFTGVIFSATAGFMLYQYKKDISDEEKYELTKFQSVVLSEFAVPFREFFDNLFNNLRKYELFDQLFGPAEIHHILPAPLPKGLGREYTIVIDIDALSEISQRDKYPAIYKRAGYDYFLTNLAQHYEVILYTNQMQGPKTEQINFKLDPQHAYFTGQLHGDCGLKERGRYSKHVEMLNRDPSKVILLDSTPAYDHDNVINVGRFHPNQKDTTLVKLLPVLLDIGQKKADVKEALKCFHKKDSKGQTPDIEHAIREYTELNGMQKKNTNNSNKKLKMQEKHGLCMLNILLYALVTRNEE
ncbi:putative mitochondrial import inner membrane translocase subunit 50 [Cavenderia fasciculata]|uniref:Mitochondrial import inner membrane translocase subunit TIM50 n=1 Tax=Cavenderia fasciculata TaxID=261658 RepID=F4QAG5_CACFS|nr:putative mitochondrial import inner membrane translocase subunit 50 [Cavenderia fasciculata]EGG15684.1 putative mitochondrial import inner membrane translocase subunit 50 [Cavenderia fasciculata]|eukprot:XP_004354426.1 putative mitochondrial import inner membrane translocase subunit 50 [Cavenderia fasciculata]